MPSDKKQRHEEAHRPGTHAAPMADDTKMSTQDTNETAAADTVAEDIGETAETGIMHAPLTGAGQAGTGSGSYAVLAGSGVGGGAAMYPADLNPDDDAMPVADDVAPEQRGLSKGRDQDSYDPQDRDLLDRADAEAP